MHCIYSDRVWVVCVELTIAALISNKGELSLVSLLLVLHHELDRDDNSDDDGDESDVDMDSVLFVAESSSPLVLLLLVASVDGGDFLFAFMMILFESVIIA